MPFLFFILAAVGVALFGAAQKQRTGEAWTSAGRRLGMSVEPGSMTGWPRLSGQFGDVVVNVSVYSTGGKNKQRFTSYEIGHPPAGPEVTMTKQAAFSGLLGFVTARTDVLVGDPLFDDRVVVDTSDEAAVRDFLTPARRAAVQDLMSVFPRATISHNAIRVASRGVSQEPDVIVATVTRLVDIAAVLGDVRFNAILGQQQDGHLLQAAEELHDYTRDRRNVFASTLEAEAMTEAGHHSQAAAAFQELWSGQPDDPVSGGWYEVANRPEPAPLVDGPEPGQPSPTAELTQEAVIGELFDRNRMSWEAVDLFEATYRNAAVDWSGQVIMASPYERDRDFDGGPGVKAVVLIGYAGRAGVLSNEISAVVEFDADVRLHEGNEVRFHGVLANLDRFGRKIWVRHATVIS